MRAAIIATILLPLASSVAHAGNVVVIESYEGTRPDDATSVLSPLHAEFRALGYQTPSNELSASVQAKVSRPGTGLSAAILAEAVRVVDAGYQRWLAGDFEEATTVLAEGLQRFQNSPASVAQEPKLRDSIQKALVGLALSHNRLGHGEEARRHMAEYIRSFPDRDFNRTLFGPEAHDLYRKVRQELEAQKRGTLRVEVDDDGAVVFINERYESVGTVERADLLPGRYRVFVQKGATSGRTHDVDVAPGTNQKLSITWQADSALHSSPDFVGFAFTNQSERLSLEAGYAAALGRGLGATGVVVITIATYQGRRAIIGSVLSLDSGRPYRMGVVALEPADPGEKAIRGLARFLAGGSPGPGLIVPDGNAGGPAGPSSGRGGGERWYRDPWGWALLATGVVVAGAGTGFALHAASLREDARTAVDESEVRRLSDSADQYRLAGLVGIGAGAALVVGGVIKLVIHETSSGTDVAIGPGWIGVKGTF